MSSTTDLSKRIVGAELLPQDDEMLDENYGIMQNRQQCEYFARTY